MKWITDEKQHVGIVSATEWFKNLAEEYQLRFRRDPARSIRRGSHALVIRIIHCGSAIGRGTTIGTVSRSRDSASSEQFCRRWWRIRRPRFGRMWCASLLACLACDPGVSRKAAPKSIVGIWRVVQFCDDDDSTGRLYDPVGPSPTGYFVYAPTGQLLIQVMRTPPVRPFAKGDLEPTDAERRELFDAYFGYYGTYTITSESTVVHHVQGGTSPSFIGTDQLRLYRVRGDTLTIGGSRRTWPCRVLLRVG